MSNKKKKKNKHNVDSGKFVFWGISYGLIFGSTVGFIICLLLDNIVWFIGGPFIGLCLGLFVGSIIQKKHDNTHKHSNNHTINHKPKKAH